MKMNPEVKTPWLERLRSDSIPQMEGWLGRPSGDRCCLGVLCDIAYERDVIDTREVGSDGVYQYGIVAEDDEHDDDLDATDLPRAVKQWAWGQTYYNAEGDDSPVFVDHPEYGRIHLAVLNDGAVINEDGSGGHTHSVTGRRVNVPKHTFAQIADLIEAQL